MWEGIDEPLPDGNWPVMAPSPLPYSPRNQVPRAMTREDMDARAVRIRGGGSGCGRGRVRPARAALRARLPAVVVPVAGDEHPRRRLRRIAGGARAVPAGGVRCVPRDLARRQADERADLRDRLGPGRLSPRRGGGVRADAARARMRHRRRVLGSGHAARASGVRAQLPDPVRRPDPQRGRDPHDRRRRDLELRRRQHDHRRRPRRHVRAGAAAPVRPALDAARRRRAGLRRRDVAGRSTRPDRGGRRPDATSCARSFSEGSKPCRSSAIRTHERCRG